MIAGEFDESNEQGEVFKKLEKFFKFPRRKNLKSGAKLLDKRNAD